MEEEINGKKHVVIDAEKMTDIGMKIPVTFTIEGKKYVSTLNGRIEPKDTHKAEE